MSTVLALANIASEVHRMVKFLEQHNSDRAWNALRRSFQLLDAAIEHEESSFRQRELLRLREGIAAVYLGSPVLEITPASLERYLGSFVRQAQNSS